ncbi:hypothetical protein EAG_08417 [Camponotus floridanus]|uniref:Uncharacterized protein n=1 Tax=Camponotus floridanus TaxID=104421 RepID=E1ZYT0_CAMFO|nr:hypothetical protein EAG_08417 [Camponotus floridanus]
MSIETSSREYDRARGAVVRNSTLHVRSSGDASETYDKYMLHSISCVSENGGRCNQFHAFSNANLRRRKRGDTAEKELLEERNLAERETDNTPLMSSTHRYLYLYESVFFISIWVSELPVSFHLQLMPFTMISEKKESGFLFPFPMRRSVREVTVEIHADVEDGRSRARVSLYVFLKTRAPEFDEGTNASTRNQ